MAHRFLYDLMSSSMITASDVAQGRVTAGTKEKSTGGADGSPGGVFTGSSELQWIVQIDAGTTLGTATFQYSTDGGVTFTRSGILTSATAVTLEQGVTFTFTAAASGADFAVGDRWRFKTTLPYGVASMTNFQNANVEWRSSGITGSKSFDVDFGVAGRIVRAAYLLYHNLSDRRDGGAQASVEVKLGSSSPAAISQAQIAYATTKMGAFFPGGSYRYGRILVTNPGNTATYLKIGKLYLGNYLQLSKQHASHLPWRGDGVEYHGDVAQTDHGYRRQSIEGLGRVFPLRYTRLQAADYASLIALRDSVWDDTTNRENRPLIFVPDHRVPADAYLCYLTAFTPQRDHPLRNSVEMELTEVVRRKV